MIDPALYSLISIGATLHDIDTLADSGLTMSDVLNPYLTDEEVKQLALGRSQRRLAPILTAARTGVDHLDQTHGVALLYAFGMSQNGATQMAKYFQVESALALTVDQVISVLETDAMAFKRRQREIKRAVSRWRSWLRNREAMAAESKAEAKTRAEALKRRLAVENSPVIRRTKTTPIGHRTNAMSNAHQAKALRYLKIDALPDTLVGMLATDFYRKKIFVGRLEGQDLREIGKDIGMSHQGVANVLKKFEMYLPMFLDVEAYRELLSQYALSREQFVLVTKADPVIWDYLRNLDGVRGKQSGRQYIFACSQLSQAQKQQYADDHQLIMMADGTATLARVGTIAQAVLEKSDGAVFELADFIAPYNAYVKDHNLPERLLVQTENQARNLWTALEKLPVVRRTGWVFRPYDLESLKPHLAELNALFDREPGIYSSWFLYGLDIDLMQQLDIRDPDELADLVSQLGLAEFPMVTRIIRQIRFIIKLDDPSDFYLEAIFTHEHQTTNMIAQELSQRFGLNALSVQALLNSDYRDYFRNGKVTLV